MNACLLFPRAASSVTPCTCVPLNLLYFGWIKRSQAAVYHTYMHQYINIQEQDPHLGSGGGPQGDTILFMSMNFFLPMDSPKRQCQCEARGTCTFSQCYEKELSERGGCANGVTTLPGPPLSHQTPMQAVCRQTDAVASELSRGMSHRLQEQGTTASNVSQRKSTGYPCVRSSTIHCMS